MGKSSILIKWISFAHLHLHSVILGRLMLLNDIIQLQEKKKLSKTDCLEQSELLIHMET